MTNENDRLYQMLRLGEMLRYLDDSDTAVEIGLLGSYLSCPYYQNGHAQHTADQVAAMLDARGDKNRLNTLHGVCIVFGLVAPPAAVAAHEWSERATAELAANPGARARLAAYIKNLDVGGSDAMPKGM